MLGIGIITYKRCEVLATCLEGVLKHTRSPYRLVVADDGGEDGTVEHCRSRNVQVLTGPNAGVCRNKNRALFCLRHFWGCDPVLIIEDDLWPVQDGWEQEWIHCASRHNHVGYAYPRWRSGWRRGGSGTGADPYLTWEMTGQLNITSGLALDHVGYLDSRFRGYGWGHIHWTNGYAKAGYIHPRKMPVLNCGVEIQRVGTFRTPEQVHRNRRVYDKVRREGWRFPVMPWQTDEQRVDFMHELKHCLGVPL
jgi:glycosyltransferase involved in cell wall biosynthesis